MTINEWTDEQAASQRKWLEALESGEYKQGEGLLRSHDDRYCCLGVALAIRPIVPGGCEGWVQADSGFFFYKTLLPSDVHFTTTDLPEKVRQELGISIVMHYVAIHMNDTLRWDFMRIALVFRRYFGRPQLSSDWLNQDDLKKILDIPFHVQATIKPDPPILD